jgi:hypothetical protein
MVSYSTGRRGYCSIWWLSLGRAAAEVPQPSMSGEVERRSASGPAGPRPPGADYLKGTVTGPGTLENTAMKSRSSGVR